MIRMNLGNLRVIWKMKNFDMLVRIFVLFSFIILFSLSLTSVSSADFGDIREAIDGTDSGKTITLKNTTYNGNGSQIPIYLRLLLFRDQVVSMLHLMLKVKVVL